MVTPSCQGGQGFEPPGLKYRIPRWRDNGDKGDNRCNACTQRSGFGRADGARGICLGKMQ